MEKVKRFLVNEEVLMVAAEVQRILAAISWGGAAGVFFPAFATVAFLDNGGVDWAHAVGVIGRAIYGLMAFFFAYCENVGNIATYTQQVLANPCSVECGLLSYIVLPAVRPLMGFVLVILGVGSFLQLLWDSVILVSLSFLQRMMNFLKPITGRQSQGGFENVKFSPVSPNSAVFFLIIGFVLMRGDSGGVVTAVASIASGLAMVGMLFILNVVGGLIGANICGAGGG